MVMDTNSHQVFTDHVAFLVINETNDSNTVLGLSISKTVN